MEKDRPFPALHVLPSVRKELADRLALANELYFSGKKFATEGNIVDAFASYRLSMKYFEDAICENGPLPDPYQGRANTVQRILSICENAMALKSFVWDPDL